MLTEHERVLVIQAGTGMFPPTLYYGFNRQEMLDAYYAFKRERKKLRKELIEEFGYEEGMEKFRNMSYDVPYDYED